MRSTKKKRVVRIALKDGVNDVKATFELLLGGEVPTGGFLNHLNLRLVQGPVVSHHITRREGVKNGYEWSNLSFQVMAKGIKRGKEIVDFVDVQLPSDEVPELRRGDEVFILGNMDQSYGKPSDEQKANIAKRNAERKAKDPSKKDLEARGQLYLRVQTTVDQILILRKSSSKVLEVEVVKVKSKGVADQSKDQKPAKPARSKDQKPAGARKGRATRGGGFTS